MNRDQVIDELFDLFTDKGQGAYFGESVSEMEHALQAAHLAVTSGANIHHVVAALLHDVGHLLHGLGENIADHDIDSRHEEAGADWLEQYFGPEVIEPIRMHVPAKRYLCAVDPTYQASLSPASIKSLQLQGGPMTTEEVALFETLPFFRSAVVIRRWDDGAKLPGWDVPGLETYRSHLEQALSSSSRSGKCS